MVSSGYTIERIIWGVFVGLYGVFILLELLALRFTPPRKRIVLKVVNQLAGGVCLVFIAVRACDPSCVFGYLSFFDKELIHDSVTCIIEHMACGFIISTLTASFKQVFKKLPTFVKYCLFGLSITNHIVMLSCNIAMLKIGQIERERFTLSIIAGIKSLSFNFSLVFIISTLVFAFFKLRSNVIPAITKMTEDVKKKQLSREKSRPGLSQQVNGQTAPGLPSSNSLKQLTENTHNGVQHTHIATEQGVMASHVVDFTPDAQYRALDHPHRGSITHTATVLPTHEQQKKEDLALLTMNEGPATPNQANGILPAAPQRVDTNHSAINTAKKYIVVPRNTDADSDSDEEGNNDPAQLNGTNSAGVSPKVKETHSNISLLPGVVQSNEDEANAGHHKASGPPLLNGGENKNRDNPVDRILNSSYSGTPLLSPSSNGESNPPALPTNAASTTSVKSPTANSPKSINRPPPIQTKPRSSGRDISPHSSKRSNSLRAVQVEPVASPHPDNTTVVAVSPKVKSNTNPLVSPTAGSGVDKDEQRLNDLKTAMTRLTVVITVIVVVAAIAVAYSLSTSTVPSLKGNIRDFNIYGPDPEKFSVVNNALAYLQLAILVIIVWYSHIPYYFRSNRRQELGISSFCSGLVHGVAADEVRTHVKSKITSIK